MAFIKEAKVPKMEFSLDLKAGKCYKVETNTYAASSSGGGLARLNLAQKVIAHRAAMGTGAAASSNNNNSSSSSSSGSGSGKDNNNNTKQQASDKAREHAEILDSIGNQNGFVVCICIKPKQQQQQQQQQQNDKLYHFDKQIETKNELKVLMINEKESIVNEWVALITSIVSRYLAIEIAFHSFCNGSSIYVLFFCF